MSSNQPPSSSSPPVNPLLGLPVYKRIQVLRQAKQLSVATLAARSGLSVELVEDIEAGLETVLATTTRRRLARVLQVPSLWLRAEEETAHWFAGSARTTEPPQPLTWRVNRKNELIAGNKRLPLLAMAQQPDGFWPCPNCGAALRVRTFERRDLEETPITALALTCTQCLFTAQPELVDV